MNQSESDLLVEYLIIIEVNFAKFIREESIGEKT